MSERPTQAETMKLAKECGMVLIEATEAYPSQIRTYDSQLDNFAAKLRAKDAELIKAISDAHIATQAREAMMFKVLCLYGNHDEDCAKYSDKNLACDCLFGKAISNSTEHTEKWLAEHDAKVLESAADWFDKDWSATKAQLRRMANELRGGK